MKTKRIVRLCALAVGLALTLAADTSHARGPASNPTPATPPADPVEAMPGVPRPPKAPKAPRAPRPPKPPRLEGRLPENPPKVSIVLEDETIGHALEVLAEQTGWSLLVTTNAIEESITMKMKQVPADEALEAILEAGDLHAKFRKNTLSVYSVPADEEDEVDQTDNHDFKFEFHDAEDRKANGEDLEISEDEVVDSAVATGGNLTVRGRVRDDAVSIGGNVTLKPGSQVDGDAVALGGKVIVEKGAVLRGNRTSMAGSLGGLLKAISKSGKGKIHIDSHDRDDDNEDEEKPRHNGNHDEGWFFYPPGAMLRAFLGFLLCLLFVGFVPERLAEVRQLLERRPQYAGLAGILLGLCFIPLIIMLTLTLVGIPLVPVAVVLFFIAMAMGYVVIAQWIGERLPILVNRKTPLTISALGVGVLMLFDFIPFFGFFVVTCLCLFGAGGAVLTRYGKPGATDTLSPSILG